MYSPENAAIIAIVWITGSEVVFLDGDKRKPAGASGGPLSDRAERGKRPWVGKDLKLESCLRPAPGQHSWPAYAKNLPLANFLNAAVPISSLPRPHSLKTAKGRVTLPLETYLPGRETRRLCSACTCFVGTSTMELGHCGNC